MAENYSDKKTLVSEYNEASFQIIRLHSLWTKANNYSMQGNLIGLKWVLDRVWIELSADAKGKKGDYEEGIKELNKKIALAQTNPRLYNALQDKEIFLRCLQEDVGKGGKKREEFEDMM